VSVAPTYQGWWTDEFGPGGTANGGIYADKSYWLATEDWDVWFGNTNQNYPFDTALYSSSGGFGNGYVPLLVVVGYQNKVYFNENGTDFRAALRLAIDEMPDDPPVMSVSETEFNPSCVPDNNVTDLFNMSNTGLGPLNYFFSVDYEDIVAAGSNWHTNDFNTALVYTGNGWATYIGGTWNDGTDCADAADSSTPSVMTSGTFDTSGIGDRLWLEFRYGFSYQTNASITAEYFTGVTWETVWSTPAWGGVGTIKVELPIKSVNTQLRFTAVSIRGAQNTWSIERLDDIKVYSDDVSYRWVQFDQRNSWGEPTDTGTINAGNNQDFNVTFDAAGLAEGTYNANIMLHTNYPQEIDKAIPVVFTVSSGGGTTPAVPANLTTTLVSGQVYINWDDSADATSYDVYSSADPYGTFGLITNVIASEFTYIGTETKMFFYIVAKNSTKQSPRSITIKAK